MCGIAGTLDLGPVDGPIALDQLRRMTEALSHRGPDEMGLYRDAVAALGHARLSIVDLRSGQQPLSNEDGTVWAVFNGEIFNFVELRTELESHGHRFHTRSDTEVIVHAWEQWGARAFDRFNGQWAVALWDTTRRELVLSRDPHGICPLFVSEHAGRLYFASGVRAIFAADPAICRDLDPLGLDEVFTFWSTVPPRTVFRAVREVRPGTVTTFGRGRAPRTTNVAVPSYPTSEAGQFSGTLEDAVEATRSALLEATRLRVTRSDVPVGCYLSGGLDSSLTAALGLGLQGRAFASFSVRFDEAEFDEGLFQQLVARHLGTEHVEIRVSRADIGSAWPEVVRHAERPVLRTAPAPLFLLSALVRQRGFKVVLTGEGADEMFAGYDIFREGKIRRFWARQPSSRLRPLLLDRLYPYMARSPVAQRRFARAFFGRHLEDWQKPGFTHGPRWRATAAARRLYSDGQRAAVDGQDVVADLLGDLPDEFSSWHPLAQDEYLEARTLLAGYLLSSQGDRMLMAHSVEGRFPFLDSNVVALAHALPPEFKLRVLDEKHVLKRLAVDRLPAAITERRKQPYRAPDAACFVGDGSPPWVRELTSPSALEDCGVFDPVGVRRLFDKCERGLHGGPLSNTDNMALVGVLSTQLVHEQFVRHRPAPGPARAVTTLVDRMEGHR